MEKEEKKVKHETCSVKGTFIICPLAAFVPTEGVFGSLPNLLEMKAQLPNHERQRRTEEGKDFSSTKPSKRIWASVIVAKCMWECSKIEFSRPCVLESSVGHLKFT